MHLPVGEITTWNRGRLKEAAALCKRRRCLPKDARCTPWRVQSLPLMARPTAYPELPTPAHACARPVPVCRPCSSRRALSLRISAHCASLSEGPDEAGPALRTWRSGCCAASILARAAVVRCPHRRPFLDRDHHHTRLALFSRKLGINLLRQRRYPTTMALLPQAQKTGHRASRTGTNLCSAPGLALRMRLAS